MSGIAAAVRDPRNAPVVNAIRSVASQLGVDVNLALATAYQESGFRPTAVGDNGSSFGIYQLHRGGELGSLTPEQAYDPTRNAQVSLGVVKQVQGRMPGSSPGTIAAAAQRPADRAGYARSVDNLYSELGGTFLPSLPATPGLPSLTSETTTQAPQVADNEGYLINLTMPSAIPNIKVSRAVARKIVGAVILTNGAVIVLAGVFVLTQGKLPQMPGQVGAVQGAVKSASGAGRRTERAAGRAQESVASTTPDELAARRKAKAADQRGRAAAGLTRSARAQGEADAEAAGDF